MALRGEVDLADKGLERRTECPCASGEIHQFHRPKLDGVTPRADQDGEGLISRSSADRLAHQQEPVHL